MSRAQSSILSFFQPRQQPNYAPPPSRSQSQPQQRPPQPPPPPPPAPSAATARYQGAKAGGVPLIPAASTLTSTTSTPPPPPPPSVQIQIQIHPQATVSPPAGPEHVAALRRINSLLLPVSYPDSFYNRILDPVGGVPYCRVILWRDDDASDDGKNTSSGRQQQVIGGIVSRLEEHPDPSRAAAGEALLYIQSLALLSPYRSLGLAGAALEAVVASSVSAAAALSFSPRPVSAAAPAGVPLRVTGVYAHVWTENEEGLRWYAARGFARLGAQPVAGYYFKLRPDTAWVVQRDILPLSSPQTTPASNSSPTPAIPATVTAAAANLPPISSISSPNARGPSPRPTPSSSSGLSFQNARPETEWNDLPPDMVSGPPPAGAGAPSSSALSSRSNSRSNLLLSSNSAVEGEGTGTGTGMGTGTGTGTPRSGASSRSSSTAAGPRRKKERAYPAAAFGN